MMNSIRAKKIHPFATAYALKNLVFFCVVHVRTPVKCLRPKQTLWVIKSEQFIGTKSILVQMRFYNDKNDCFYCVIKAIRWLAWKELGPHSWPLFHYHGKRNEMYDLCQIRRAAMWTRKTCHEKTGNYGIWTHSGVNRCVKS